MKIPMTQSKVPEHLHLNSMAFWEVVVYNSMHILNYIAS
jgi:hypothetical protein